MISKEMTVKMMNENELFGLVSEIWHNLKAKIEEGNPNIFKNITITDKELNEIGQNIKNRIEQTIQLGENDELTELKNTFIQQLDELNDWQGQDELINSFLTECRERRLGAQG